MNIKEVISTVNKGCSQTAVQWNQINGDDLLIRIATVRNTIQTVNSPMYDTYMSTPGNTAKLGATHSNIQTAQRGPSLTPWLGANLQCISQHTTESALYSLCQPGMRSSEISTTN